MRIGIPAETLAGEARVAATPETVKKFIAQGHSRQPLSLSVTAFRGASPRVSVQLALLPKLFLLGCRGAPELVVQVSLKIIPDTRHAAER